jgi:hypothetical protein
VANFSNVETHYTTKEGYGNFMRPVGKAHALKEIDTNIDKSTVALLDTDSV